MSRQTTKQRRDRYYARQSVRIDAMRADLLPGETLCRWCADCTECGCPATHDFSTVPCLWVAHNMAERTTRCLSCDAVWTFRANRTDPSRLIRAGRREAA